MDTTLDEITALMLLKIEAELKDAVEQIAHPALFELNAMLAYHLGWETDIAGKSNTGKRIRPLLVLLSAAASGGEWQAALPAASAVELIHNFSLIHDDIQDNSPLRRGRSTVWKIWGIPQAINSGDSMYSLACLALLRLTKLSSCEITLQAARILLDTALRLTEGQYLDLAYEKQDEIILEDYWLMIGRKTANLLSACTKIGALVGGGQGNILEAYHEFGYELGLAFQVQDDMLGIWGEAVLTGKSTDSDLISGKKSLPVIYGLNQKGNFFQRWMQGPVLPQDVPGLAKQLEIEGARDHGMQEVTKHTEQALSALESAHPISPYSEILKTLTMRLLTRST
jgi:geranylgeranyl diphosphate synthase type I